MFDFAFLKRSITVSSTWAGSEMRIRYVNFGLPPLVGSRRSSGSHASLASAWVAPLDDQLASSHPDHGHRCAGF